MIDQILYHATKRSEPAQGFYRRYACFLTCVMIGEATLRGYFFLKKVFTQNDSIPMEFDSKLGWRTVEHFQLRKTRIDAGGNSYLANLHFQKNGFRIFGDVHSKKKKILFIGDSFTHAFHVSDGKEYYSYLGKKLPIEVFAYGCGGYSTLQEYMILDMYFDEIKPDAVVFQFTENDLFNNQYELEIQSLFKNNGLSRPYLNLQGEIIYKTPSFLPGVREFAFKHSRFLHYLFTRVDLIRRSFSKGDPFTKKFGEDPYSFAGFRDSVKITNQIFQKIRNRVPPHVKIYGFEVIGAQPYYQIFQELSKNNGIIFIDGIPQAIQNAEKLGQITKIDDRSHWNETGNQIASEALFEFLKEEWK